MCGIYKRYAKKTRIARKIPKPGKRSNVAKDCKKAMR